MSEERLKLNHIEVKGFKSIPPEGQLIYFGDITILLGANGSGKSNLVSFFKLLNHLTSNGLQVFIQKQGGADALLYYGSKHTEKIDFSINFTTNPKGNWEKKSYEASLVHGMPDRLFFAMEKVKYLKPGMDKWQENIVQSLNGESGLSEYKSTTEKSVADLLNGIRTYQFHDTSDTAKIKSSVYIDDARYLRGDAANLAAFLYAMTLNNSKYYNRIIRHIQKVMPQFKDFELEPGIKNDKNVKLNWRDTQGETLFGPHQISDGSLRFMALAALLLQPSSMIPQVIVIDEPELGLHPAAIAELAGMIKTASKNAQIIVATQSTRLVDEFEIDDIVIAERNEKNHNSVFRRLDEKQLQEWLERYSVSELWEKNVLGGQP